MVDASASSRVGVARAVGIIGILAYVLSWLANQNIPGFRDPLWLRAVVVALLAATVLGTYVSAWAVRRLSELLRALVYIITLHDFLLLVWNRLDALQVMGTYLVLAGVVATSSLFFMRPRHLAEYLATVATLSIVTVLAVDEARTAKPQFLVGIATFTALSYVAVRAHLQTLGRLRESEAEARAVVRAVPDVLVRVGAGGVVVAVLGEPQNELGLKVKALVGRPLHELFHDSPADVVAGLSSQPGPGEVRTFSAPVPRAGDGAAPFFVEVRFLGGDADAGLALLRDVTRERRLEARLRVNDRLAAIGTLASGIGHEINNPLSYVISNVKFVSQMLRMRGHVGPGDDGSEEELSALEDARRGAERIGAIVRSLKSYASGTETLELSADASECVKAAVTILGSEIRHHAELTVDIGPMPLLRAEPLRMTQLLVNLISNALQSLPPNDSRSGHIWIRGGGSSGVATLEVQDDGCGIPPADLTRVFDPFFTTKSPGQGTGLGLYVCHQTVTALGGTIEVTSKQGVGTKFRIVLPTVELAPGEDLPKTPENPK